MKKTLFKSVLCATLFVGALTSCNDVEDLYNPELVREKAKKALGLDIAADQDWNMTSVVTANVTLNEDALSDYSFRIYSGNPINDAKAVVLADYPVKTDAQGKASASFKFEMPSYLNYVYVARVDDHGRRMIGLSKIQNGAISKAFGESSSVSTKAVTDYAFPTITPPYSEDDVNALLTDAYDLTKATDSEGGLGNNGFKDMKNLTGKTVAKITGEDVVCKYNKGFQVTDHKDTLIIADGATWEIPDNGGILEIRNVDIIVANGGTLKFTGKLQLTGSTRLIVMEGGVVDNTTSVALSNGEYSIKVDGTGGGHTAIYNAGTIDANYIYADQGAALYNTETGVWKTKTTHCAGGNGWENFINWGKIESDAVSSNGDQGTLYNACLIRANLLTVAQLSIKDNSAIEVPEIHCNAMYLRENSIIRTTTLKSNSQIVIDYIGVEGGKALVSAKTFDLGNTPKSIEYNNVYIENVNLLMSGQNNEWFIGEFYKAVPQLNIFGIGEAPLYIINDETEDIEEAECTGNGNKPNNYVPPTPANTITYAFEDLNKEVGDYDMNDVVLKCTGPVDGKITIKLVAVGAQKNLFVYFKNKQDNKQVALFDGKEAHSALGVAEGTITNTGIGDAVSSIEQTISVSSDFLFSTHGDIYIVDEQGRESHVPNFDSSFVKGDAPYGICVPCDWRYPQEYVSIIKAYPAFKDWAGDINEQDWYTEDKAESGKVY